MNNITNELLRVISDFRGKFDGAFNIRENGQCAGRQSSKNIRIESKEDAPGLVIHINPYTKGERVYIPACVTHGDIDDLVYNDFYVGEGADVVIVAGCGVHTDNEEEARHNGIHRFFLAKNSHVIYEEKHIGTGKGLSLIHIWTDSLKNYPYTHIRQNFTRKAFYHLRIYRKNIPCTVSARKHFLPVQKHSERESCLLYTSRCV